MEAYFSVLPEAGALQTTLTRVAQAGAGEGGDASRRRVAAAAQPRIRAGAGLGGQVAARPRAGARRAVSSSTAAMTGPGPGDGAGAIEIDAGRAFGTAHHGTTRGCLLAIEALTKRRRFANALDLGCGSGVLAIAAAKMGVRRVLATDIDPIAIERGARQLPPERRGAVRRLADRRRGWRIGRSRGGRRSI